MPKVKTEADYPDRLAYLQRSDNRLLVMVRKRLPITKSHTGRPVETNQTGYFTEAYELDKDGNPNFQISDLSELVYGRYNRVEVTDELEDPYYRSARLTPTIFSNIARTRFQERLGKTQTALPFPEEKATGQIADLFANLKLQDMQKKFKAIEDKTLKDEITEKFFKDRSVQGMSNDISNVHIVMTDEPEDSQLFYISNREGIKTIKISPDEILENKENHQGTVFDRIVNKQGSHPLVITLDSASLGQSFSTSLRRSDDIARSHVLRYEKKNPMFAFIERLQGKYETTVDRLDYGYYYVHGLDQEVMRKLLLKISADYALTSQTRKIASALT